MDYCRTAAHNTSKRTGIDYERCLIGTQRLTAGGQIGCENHTIRSMRFNKY